MATKIDIIQRAVVRLGAEVPQSVDDDRDDLIAANQLYDSIVEDRLTRHAHKWSQETVEISRLVATPKAPWTTAYQLPADCLSLLDVFDELGYPVDYDIQSNETGSMIVTRRTDDTLVALMVWKSSEERWPGDFAKAVEEDLLGQLLETFDEHNKGAERRQMAEAMFSRVQRRDRRQANGKKMDRSPLLNAYRNKAERV